MLNYPILSKALGTLLLLEAVLLGVCFGMGYTFRETDHLTFGVPLLISLMLGGLLLVLGRRAENRMSRRDAYLIVSLTWVIFSAIGMLPFLLGGYTDRVAAAFTETMSGFTTTGATVFADVDALPRSILVWRSLTHWIGGMGIVFFTIAVLPNISGGNTRLFAAEATGLKIGKLHPRIATTARWMWTIYLTLTVVCILAYWACGMSLFDAVNHGLSTIGTGGFSTHTAGFAWFDSSALEWVSTLFMVIAGINCTLLYLLFVKHRWSAVWHDGELRLFLLIFAAGVVIITGFNIVSTHQDFLTALRGAAFNVASMQSTTGFCDENYMTWHPVTWVVLTIVSIIGACAGSTSGGLKVVRVLMTWKMVKTEFRQLLHPHAVLPIYIDGRTVTLDMARTLLAYLVVYVILVTIGSTVMIAEGLPMLDAFGLAVSSFSNVGPSVGYVISPVDGWGILSDLSLWICSFLMLAGRLEVFSLLLLFTPGFWRSR